MKNIILISFCLYSFAVFGQQKSKKQALVKNLAALEIPLKAENWKYDSGKVEFSEYDSRKVMKIAKNSPPVVLRNLDFTDGTIDFDFIPMDKLFASVYFHWQDSKENECFYFRTDRVEDSTAMDAMQYSPDVSGVNLWDLFGHYQGNAYFRKDRWNHVRLVISGLQMRAYVNNMENPVVEIPRLEGNVTKGTIAFDGESVISNLIIKANETGNLPPVAGIDPIAHDPRYLRSWQVSKPFETPQDIDFSNTFIPKADEIWQPLQAERMGLMNLTRKFGGNVNRRMVWLKVNIDSKTDQKKKLALGFSDEVWVLLNGKYLYVDKNSYGWPIMKEPFGRCSIENSSFDIPFKAGKNELLIGVSNNFFGWGIVARLEDMEGIAVERW